MRSKDRGSYRPDNVKEPKQIARYPWIFDDQDISWVNKNEVWCKALMEEHHMMSILCVKSSILSMLNLPYIPKNRLDYLKFFDMINYHPRMVVEQNPRYKLVQPYTLVVRDWKTENPLLLFKESRISDLGFSKELLLCNQRMAHPLNLARYPVKKIFYEAGNKRVEYLGLANVEKFYLRPVFLLHWEGKAKPRDKANDHQFVPIKDLIEKDLRLSTIGELVKNNILKEKFKC